MKIDKRMTNGKLFSVRGTNTTFEWIIEDNMLIYIFDKTRKEVKKLEKDKWCYIVFSHEAKKSADNFFV